MTPQNKNLIDPKQRWQLKYWANEFKISVKFLVKLVSKAGTSVENIRRNLKEIRLYTGQ